MKAILVEVAPHLKPVAHKLLDIAQRAMIGLLEFLASITVAGFLFSPGPRLVNALRAISRRIISRRGEEMVQLVGANIRNVSRGVVGIALLQSILAGAGFLAAGIPAAGVLAFLALLLGIVQIGPSILLIPIIVWSWTAMQTTDALIFTPYMIPVSLVDNLLRPILMARGLATPIPVIMIGAMGGTLAYGIVGLFFGPIVFSVAWAMMVVWVQEGDAVVEISGAK